MLLNKIIFEKSLLTGILLCGLTLYLQGQAPLVLQGALQKPSGEPFDDGPYSVTFALYEVQAGGTALWSETQPAVQVLNGLYNVLLGSVTPLTVPFSKTYYLGVSVDGGEELAPRARLGASPYTVSIIGQANMFPSSGPAGVGTLTPDTAALLSLKNPQGNGTLIIEGRQNAELQLKKGGNTSPISFDGNQVVVPNLNIEIKDNLDLPPGAAIRYTGIGDWRLVDRDDFSSGTDGWTCVDDWTNNSQQSFERIRPNTPFSKSFLLRPTQNGNDILKKQFDLTGIPHSMIKVVFTYHFLDTWDNEGGFAAFASQELPFTGQSQQNGYFQVGWRHESPAEFNFNGIGYFNETCFPNNSFADAAVQGEMVAQHTGDSFWLFFGAFLNEAACNESYGIANIEIWVR